MIKIKLWNNEEFVASALQKHLQVASPASPGKGIDPKRISWAQAYRIRWLQ